MKNLKIATQLKLGFAALLLLVIILGIASYLQTDKINLQTEIIYNHPLQVKKAISNLEKDILNTQIATRDLLLSINNDSKHESLQLIEISNNNALQQFNILYKQYLGSRTNIDEAFKAYIKWKIAREETNKLTFTGEIETAKAEILTTGTEGIYRDQLLSKIKIIYDFANKKSITLYYNSRELNTTLKWQLIVLVITILLLSLLINSILLKNIRKPLDELINVSIQFKNGDTTARSTYESRNEFGMLSTSFNTMVESINLKNELDERFANLAALMLSEYDARKFFQTTLFALAKHTGSQMAAIYLLNNDKKTFEHFESLGIDDNARQSFAANRLEGEFGSVLSSHKVQHIKNISDDTRFIFHTVSGKFIPREIITIPIIADNEVTAIISLASVDLFSNQTIQLIDKILVTLCARVEGIMAYHKMKDLFNKLEQQNSELESQKTELASQSAELIEQNTELEMQKNQLNEASRLKTNFLSNMSHELRTPLNSVIALSGVLNRRLVNDIPEEEYSFLKIIERNGKHLLSLINDILDISRIEAGREEIEISTFNANSVIADIVNMIKPQSNQKFIELLHDKKDTNLTITSDAGKCRHILQNLISNAIKFTEKGKVEISGIINENNIEIKIIDTGIGISENNLIHIFEEFRQADGSTSRKYGGTGLGLAIAKKYANLLGGSISVKSVLGAGSEFTITLPLMYVAENRIIEEPELNEMNEITNPTPQRFVTDASIKTILLVEDSEPAIIQMKEFLEESNYNILVAHNGSEALEIITHTIPDSIILDLMMPGIDGFEVLKTIRDIERTAHIPVLILTAKHITKEELKFLKRNNIHQLIQKGDVKRDELLNAVITMVSPQNIKLTKQQLEQTFLGKPIVLVIEDNPDNMITVKAMLADDYTVIEAGDGNTGIEMAKKHLPNLILMDIELPNIDGIKAFKTIRNDTQMQFIPVIALTASAMTTDRETILAHGFDAYIAKPIDDKIFYKTINMILNGK